MVNKLEKGSTIQSTMYHQEGLKSNNGKCKEQSQKKKSLAHCANLGHFASKCPSKLDDKTSLPKKKTRKSKRKCYGCTEKGHEIASRTHKKDGLCRSSNKSQIGKEASKKQDEKESCKDKHRICYTCWAKGYIGKNCPKGKIPKPKSSIDHSLLRKVICSPHVSTKVIWVPKPYVTNIYGPN
uniref:CCHC-type domain-containing protein n=1 Tax=Setaria italica TaxID=4555 RepID=K4AJG8_SETIT